MLLSMYSYYNKFCLRVCCFLLYGGWRFWVGQTSVDHQTPSQMGEGQVGRGNHKKEEGEEGDLKTQRHQQH